MTLGRQGQHLRYKGGGFVGIGSENTCRKTEMSTADSCFRSSPDNHRRLMGLFS